MNAVAAETRNAHAYDAQKQRAHDQDPRVRRDLAGDPAVRPEILFYLASDEAAEVRCAIAANASTPLHAFKSLAGDGDAAVRTALAEKIALLFPQLGALEQERARTRVLGALDILARDQLARVRQILAEALKDRLDAPPGVIQRLARDMEIAVAGPVLRCSPLLTDEDLLDIIGSDAPEGALAAIAERRSVGPSVADAIATAANVQAVAALLANPSAQIREETLDRLLDAAPAIEDWHRPLVERPSLPSRAVRRIATFVANSLLDALRGRDDLDPAALDDVAAEMKRRLDTAPAPAEARETAPNLAPPPREPAPIRAAVARVEDSADAERERARAMFRAHTLTADEISDAMFAGHRAFAIEALSLLSKLPHTVIEQIATSRSGPGLTALAWKAGLGAEFAVHLQLHLGKLPPNGVLMPRGGQFPMPEGDLHWQIVFFSTLATKAVA